MPRIYRPNKLAQGIENTAKRSNHRLSDDASALAVFGTCDPLRFGIFFGARSSSTEGMACRCCGQRIRRFSLTKLGQQKLRLLRIKARRRAEGAQS